MEQYVKTVIIADASGTLEESAAENFRMLGFEAAAIVSDGREVVRAVQRLQPDAVVLDAVLPVLDGAAAAEEILALQLNVRPIVLIAVPEGMTLRRTESLEAGGCAILPKPLEKAAVEEALRSAAPLIRRVPEKIAARLENLLDRLGLPEREGRAFLKKSILCVWQDGRLLQALTKRLYPMVAESFGVDAKKVERDMRRAIEYAWKYGKIDEQYAIFGGTIDAQRGKPTCGEMIAQLADILRLEG